MAAAHGCGSGCSTPTPGLGLGSPWGSITSSHSSCMESVAAAAAAATAPAAPPAAVAAAVADAAGLALDVSLAQRDSSPSGLGGSLTPRSPCGGSYGPAADAGQQQVAAVQVWQGACGMQLPADLGLGDSSCGDELMLHHQLLAAAQHGQQQLSQHQAEQQQLAGLLPAGLLGSFHSGQQQQGGMGSGGFGGPSDGMLGSGYAQQQQQAPPGLMGAVPPPPPPPPPPPAGSRGGPGAHGIALPPLPLQQLHADYPPYGDGRMSGAASPVPGPGGNVPAPPPRAHTPGSMWSSPCASPRYGGQGQVRLHECCVLW